MSDVDWNLVVIKIKFKRRWPRKVIAAKVGASESALRCWERNTTEPRYSQGAELLKLANSDQAEAS